MTARTLSSLSAKSKTSTIFSTMPLEKVLRLGESKWLAPVIQTVDILFSSVQQYSEDGALQGEYNVLVGLIASFVVWSSHGGRG